MHWNLPALKANWLQIDLNRRNVILFLTVAIHIEIETEILGRRRRNVAFGVFETKNGRRKRRGSEKSCYKERGIGAERGLGTGLGNANVIEEGKSGEKTMAQLN